MEKDFLNQLISQDDDLDDGISTDDDDANTDDDASDDEVEGEDEEIVGGDDLEEQ